MTPREVRSGPLAEALLLLPARMTSPQAEVMLLAIGLQESQFEHRRQLGNGPAKSFWQGEQSGGMVTGLLQYRDDTVRDLVVGLCAVRGVAPAARPVWDAIEHDDVLAAGLARLLLWTDPGKLPALGAADVAWRLYLRTWRPGKPRPHEWPENYARALAAVQ